MEEYERPPVVLVNRSIITNENNEFLFIQRSKNEKHNTGKMEFPGGKSDGGNGPAEELIRETKEETGLLIEPDKNPVFAEGRFIRGGKYNGSIYLALYWYAKIISGEIKLSVEHDDYTWEHLDKALELNLTPGTRKVLRAIGKTALNSITQDGEPPKDI